MLQLERMPRKVTLKESPTARAHAGKCSAEAGSPSHAVNSSCVDKLLSQAHEPFLRVGRRHECIRQPEAYVIAVPSLLTRSGSETRLKVADTLAMSPTTQVSKDIPYRPSNI